MWLLTGHGQRPWFTCHFDGRDMATWYVGVPIAPGGLPKQTPLWSAWEMVCTVATASSSHISRFIAVIFRVTRPSISVHHSEYQLIYHPHIQDTFLYSPSRLYVPVNLWDILLGINLLYICTTFILLSSMMPLGRNLHAAFNPAYTCQGCRAACTVLYTPLLLCTHCYYDKEKRHMRQYRPQSCPVGYVLGRAWCCIVLVMIFWAHIQTETVQSF